MSHQWLASALCLGLLICAACAPPPASTPRERITTPPSEETAVDPYLETRLQMVERTMRSRGIKDERVLRVMETTPRHEFVPERYLNQAYADHPLPIGHGQTISQPYIVALMTELLQLEPGDKVLEIGTGSGYQAAVLAQLVDEVWTIEIIPELAEQAEQRFRRLGYANLHTRTADGYYGWPEAAPFDAIIVTAAPDHIPQPLLDQLTPDGRLVVPVGPPGGYQTLWQLVREGEDVRAYNIGGVRFVPLVGGGQSGGDYEDRFGEGEQR
ncbi:MAG TPA: protein-L-isoaspartate(D-aspartate) O-methyltransferase [Caldilineae bacterium]|nr:protein-L-isoaspartate(D-aspartate) O-methyltransferase [Caldilineae bacterium]